MKFEHRVYFQDHDKDVQDPIVSIDVPFVPRKSDILIVKGQNYRVLDIEIEYGPRSVYAVNLSVSITIRLEKTMK